VEMSYTKQNYREVEENKSMNMMREDLNLKNLGFTVVEAGEGWRGMEHNHSDRGHEEVYFLASGKASIVVDGEQIKMVEGDAVRISPDSDRQLKANEDSMFVIAGAP